MPSITITFDAAQGQRIAAALELTGTQQEQLDAYKQWLIRQTRSAVRSYELDAAHASADNAHEDWEGS